MEKRDTLEWIEHRRDRLVELTTDLWENPELGLDEHRSSQLLIDILEEEGFDIRRGVGDMSTAFVASYGEGPPRIGILGEFDALPGMSQKVAAEREPVEEGAPGHGCGHNLFAIGSLGGVLAVKQAIEAGTLDGTVVYYGCPAEEMMVGKIYMARDGAFDDLDAALTWHPGRFSTPWLRKTAAYNSIEFSFDGTAAHAAKSPASGRSALDAVQLMNTGTEYMREHIPSDAGMQYVITDGGEAPNTVPPQATVWYTVRGATRSRVESVTDWLTDVASAAAAMTQTDLSNVRYFTASYDYLPNDVVTDALWQNMEELGPIEYTDEDRAFAAELKSQFDEETLDSQLVGLPDDLKEEVKQYALYPDPIRAYTEQERVNTSTDVADVSWITPTGQFWAATWPVGAPGHTWPVVAANGSFGKKGAVYAAKVLAATTYDLLSDKETLQRAEAEHEEARGGQRYESSLPPDATPPTKLVETSD